MCLAVPGKIISVQKSNHNQITGKVSFSGIVKNVDLSCVPDSITGDYVIVHVGFALNKINEDEALKSLQLIKELGEMKE